MFCFVFILLSCVLVWFGVLVVGLPPLVAVVGTADGSRNTHGQITFYEIACVICVYGFGLPCVAIRGDESSLIISGFLV